MLGRVVLAADASGMEPVWHRIVNGRCPFARGRTRLLGVSIVDRLEALTVAGALALPERIQRVLAGPPVVIEGQTLATETQLLLRLQQRRSRARRRVAADPRGTPSAGPAVGAGRRTAADRRRPRGERRRSAGQVLRAVRRSGRRARCSCSSTAAAGCTATWTPTTRSCRFLAERAGVRVIAMDYRARARGAVPCGVRRLRRRLCRDHRAGRRVADRPRPGRRRRRQRGRQPGHPGGDGGGAPGVAVRLPAARLSRHRHDSQRPRVGRPSPRGSSSPSSSWTSPGTATHRTRRTWADPRVSPLFADVPPGTGAGLRRHGRVRPAAGRG